VNQLGFDLEWQSSIILDEILNFLSAISKGKVPVKHDTTRCAADFEVSIITPISYSKELMQKADLQN
jgi:hypothetical protein